MATSWINTASTVLGGGGSGGGYSYSEGPSSAMSRGYTGIFQVGRGNVATQTDTQQTPVKPASSVDALDYKTLILGAGALAAASFIAYLLVKNK